MKVSETTKIRHRHEINATFSKMALAAKRVLFMAIAQVDSKQLIERGQTFVVSANDYASIANVDISVAYKQLKDAGEELQGMTLEIPKSELLPPFQRAGEPLIWKKPVGNGVRLLNLTEYIDYEAGDGFIEINFTRQMEPYICRLKDGYTTQVLLSAVRLSDPNASNLYQLIRKKISSGMIKYFDITIDQLKDELNLFKLDTETTEKIYLYPEFKDFNKAVIKKSLLSIEKLTELGKLNAEVIEKRNRKAYAVRISYSIKDFGTLAVE
ncbi:replication initiation protein [Yersinia ruckeri]|uniref:Replication initiation protein n=1 Tax=Yersinia ruckeri TaxID=29486 RepID=A0A0A8VDK9_YERRU|nr:replication initiation protein [Yersinia ruckeri]EEP97643.1 hypothetical protein yruck0001_14440 [Yersinia ruckeri ATCC 29473]KGA48438.1 initiator Replication family protein [Yersinia ruckeri ATCC 29473]MCK8596726.1 replication initiation protein [Yersinia ruckeri]MCK8600020.1 replication initiation protein [Yersinia ruckeri]MCW6612512.1 replication initiation protein [Yersinia ruckeri]